PAKLANRLVHQFNRYPANGYARPFDAFGPEIQQRLLRLAEISEEEVPAIAEYHHDARWVLLTSHRLLCFQDGRLQSLALPAIRWIKANLPGPFSSDDAENARHQDSPPPQFIIHTARETLTITYYRATSFWGWRCALTLIERMCFNERL